MQEEYINEASWGKMLIFFKARKDIYIGPACDLKRFIEAVYWIARTGAQWREIPEKYGNWNTIFKRFNEWSKKKIWEGLMTFCIQDPDLENIMIDASIVRANACAAGYGNQREEALGRSAGGFSSKIHAVVDALGNPLKFALTAGQQHDVTQAAALLLEFKSAYILADKAYHSSVLREQLIKQNCVPVIPSKSNSLVPAPYDKHLYKERHVIECFFSKIKYFRRIFSRFDKTAGNYLSFLAFVGAVIWLR